MPINDNRLRVFARKLGIALIAVLIVHKVFIISPSLAATYIVTVKGDTTTGTGVAHDGEWVVDLTYDPSTKQVTFRVISGTGKLNQNSWDGWTWTVPATVSGDTVTFNGPSNFPTDKTGKEQKAEFDKLTFSGATLDTTTMDLKLTSITTSASGKDFVFNMTSIDIEKPPHADKFHPEEAESVVPADKSVNFDAAIKTLSIHGSTIVGLPHSPDALLGAKVTYPDFVLAGFNKRAGAYVFVNQDLSNAFTLSGTADTFQTSVISALYYNVSQNLFYGVLYDNAINADGSPFLNLISDTLDPGNPVYDPVALYFDEIKPDENLGAATRGFQVSGDTGATDLKFLADHPVPEPAFPFAIAGGLLGLLRWRRCSAVQTDTSKNLVR